MSFDAALRATEILLALAFLQQSAEHLISRDRMLFAARAALCLMLLTGTQTPWALTGLMALALIMLHRFQGPYNGGSDRMSLLILTCLWLATLLPGQEAKELALGYLALQLLLSYVMSGWVKITNRDWRRGQALRDVFQFSAYPVCENLRRLADRRKLLWTASWAVMLFEILFPVALLSQTALIAALTIATLFHFANACLFGLNRFLWIWLAAYPSILWLQLRVIPV